MKPVARFILVRSGLAQTRWSAILKAIEDAAVLGYTEEQPGDPAEMGGVQIAWTHVDSCATNSGGDMPPGHITKCDCDIAQLNIFELTQEQTDRMTQAMKIK